MNIILLYNAVHVYMYVIYDTMSWSVSFFRTYTVFQFEFTSMCIHTFPFPSIYLYSEHSVL